MSADDDARALADDATIDGPLLCRKGERQHRSPIVGRVKISRARIRIQTSRRRFGPASEYMYFLDPDTYLEIKVVETRKLRGAPQVTFD